MKWLKFILILLALGVGVYFLFWLIGIVGTILWYLFWIGLLGAGGYAGYKLFLEKAAPEQLEEKNIIPNQRDARHRPRSGRIQTPRTRTVILTKIVR